MIEIMHTFTTQAILDVHNHFAKLANKPEKTGWKGSKQDLINKTMLLADTKTVDAYLKATEKADKPVKPAKAAKADKPAKAKTVKADKPAKAKKTAKVKTAKGEAVPRGPVQGIGAFTKDAIAKHPEANATEIVEMVQKKFPDSLISTKSVGFYRSKMRKAGQL